jgi:hypothetical protein
MSMADNIEALPQSRGGNYELARLNALRHGVLSQYTVLPWEDGEEYRHRHQFARICAPEGAVPDRRDLLQ